MLTGINTILLPPMEFLHLGVLARITAANIIQIGARLRGQSIRGEQT
jgi:hypothetical protein